MATAAVPWQKRRCLRGPWPRPVWGVCNLGKYMDMPAPCTRHARATRPPPPPLGQTAVVSVWWGLCGGKRNSGAPIPGANPPSSPSWGGTFTVPPSLPRADKAYATQGAPDVASPRIHSWMSFSSNFAHDHATSVKRRQGYASTPPCKADAAPRQRWRFDVVRNIAPPRSRLIGVQHTTVGGRGWEGAWVMRAWLEGGGRGRTGRYDVCPDVCLMNVAVAPLRWLCTWISNSCTALGSSVNASPICSAVKLPPLKRPGDPARHGAGVREALGIRRSNSLPCTLHKWPKCRNTATGMQRTLKTRPSGDPAIWHSNSLNMHCKAQPPRQGAMTVLNPAADTNVGGESGDPAIRHSNSLNMHCKAQPPRQGAMTVLNPTLTPTSGENPAIRRSGDPALQLFEYALQSTAAAPGRNDCAEPCR
eukprot:gene6187-biopygen11851